MFCREVEQVAGLCGIRLRTGCFCNPGACAAALGLSAEAMAANYENGHVCWDDTDVIDGAQRRGGGGQEGGDCRSSAVL